MYVIDKYPGVKQRIHEEVSAVLGKQGPTPEFAG